MADLLGMSVSEFLVLTQSHTLPWLVLNNQAVVIKRIAEARREKEPSAMCVDPINWCPILALLLAQPVTDLEVYVMATLGGAASGFKQFDLADIIRIESASTALCLLKTLVEADEDKKSRVSDLVANGSCCLTFDRFELLCSSLLHMPPLLTVIRRRAILLEHSSKCMF
jgi:serine/threonine-protein kinase ATR